MVGPCSLLSNSCSNSQYHNEEVVRKHVSYAYIGLYRLSRSKHDDYERHAKGNQEDEEDQLSPVSCGVVAGLSGELFRGHVLLDLGHILGKEKHENGHSV